MQLATLPRDFRLKYLPYRDHLRDYLGCAPCYLPPPPSLTREKRELEPELEIYHAIVYHEFVVNHSSEAGLFISETLNQYKVGLLVLKLGWSVKK